MDVDCVVVVDYDYGGVVVVAIADGSIVVGGGTNCYSLDSQATTTTANPNKKQ